MGPIQGLSKIHMLTKVWHVDQVRGGKSQDHFEIGINCEWEVQGEKADWSADWGSQGAKAPQEYFI